MVAMYQQNNMKKILFILLLLPFISKAQLEQNHPEPGGHLFVGVRSTSWLRPPSDTTTNKTGIARIGTALYIGNGTYWSASGLIYTGTTPVSVSGTVISMAQASAIASGYLSSTDWSLFNAKQDALVSGTNIKTVNSSSILGSGNLSVGTVTGTGTQNYVTKWNNAGGTAIGNSQIFDNGTNVGINNASPTAKFQIKGSGTTTATNAFLVANNTPTTALFIDDGLGVHIGTSSFGQGEISSIRTGGTTATFLSIWGNATGTNNLWIAHTGSTNNWASFGAPTQTVLFQGISSANIGIGVNGSIRQFFDASNGRIGIGNISPTTTFDITGTAKASTSVTSPLLIGGTGTTSSLTYKTTTGVGTTGADHIFQVGNNGATEALRILNSGNVGIGTTSPNSTLHTNGSFATAYRAITALRTLDGTDYTIEVTANTFTVTLPTAVGITGRIYVITNSGSGVTTVGTTSSQTFANVLTTPTTLSLAQYSTVMVQSNGANWLRLTNL